MGITAEYDGDKAKIKFDPPDTPSEPIYPDLVDIRIEPEVFYEIVGEIDEEERLKNEKQGVSYVLTAQEAINRGIQIGKLSHTYEDYKERETVFDIMSRRYAGKAINTGKPFNNNDPFPVDEKIQELQEHLPKIKISEMSQEDTSPGMMMVTQALMQMSDQVERRFAKIENNLATVVRNLFRTASRMNINCVYYGGQSEYRKYATIRCLHHDRVRDGQLMTLDQCLNCTRYEPVAGKVYDILDETGKSMNLILDDNQMAFKSMKEYLDATRTERFQDQAEKAKLDPSDVETRKEGESDFKDLWSDGFKMDWSLTPVESQGPHVNYEDQSELKTLTSSYKNISYDYQSSGFYTNLEEDWATSNVITLNQGSFDRITDPKLRKYIDNGKAYAASSTDAALKKMAEGGYESFLRETCKKEGVDPLLMLALIVVESGGRVSPDNDATTTYRGLMQVDYKNLPKDYMNLPDTQKAKINIEKGVKHYKTKLNTVWKTTNHVLGMTAFNSGEGMLLGVSSRGVKPVHDPGLNKDFNASWTWEDIAPNLERNVRLYYGEKSVTEKLTYYPRIHHVYKLLLEKKGFNPLSGNLGLSLPYSSDTLKNKKVYFTSDFGMRYHTGLDVTRMHFGLDFHTGQGTPICAAAEGVIHSIGWYPGGAGRMITIDHGDNLYTVYMHLEKDSPDKHGIAKGKKVTIGQIIGNEGNTGLNMGKTGYHVHFEVRVGGNTSEFSVDPKKDIFPWMAGMKPDMGTPMKMPV